MSRRDEVDSLFERAKAMEPGERVAFLEEACRGAPELRDEVISLVEQGDAEGFFRSLGAALFSPRPGHRNDDRPIARTAGRYEVLERIGEGGMGAFYRARDTRLQREAALKFLPPGLTSDSKARERLLVEARAAAALDHPNVCTVYEIGESDDGLPFIAMAFCEGETLKERLLRGPLPPHEATRVGISIARGLSAAHARGIVHRDIKPGNVMLCPGGTVKLLDFGLARMADATLTRSGATAGTVAYMSPEQARGDPLDPRTDLWSLGVVLHEMLVGVRPFRGGNDRAVIQAILHEDPEPVTKVRAETPELLSRIVERLLSKDAAERYPTAAELLEDLERVRAPEARDPGRLRRRLPFWGRAVVLAATLALPVLAGWVVVERLQPEARGIRRLAVLPLANLTGDPHKEYFVAGMHDALVAELGRIPELTVISRQSTIRYQGSDRPLPAIARELDVEALVEGSVFLAGDSVRINAQLMRAEPEERIWAGTYHGALRDALGLQRDVARAIAKTVHAQVAPLERASRASAPAILPEAQEAYLRGLYNQERQNLSIELSDPERMELLRSAIASLEEAVALEPEWAAAHAKLARAYHWMASVYPNMATEFYPKSKAAALRALLLDEEDAQAHASLGFVLFNHDWDWAGAERSIRRAVALDPNAHAWIYALYLGAAGRHDEALQQYRRAEERNPLSTIIKSQIAWTYSCAGRHDEAVAQFEEVQSILGREADWLRANVGYEYLHKSLHGQAIAELGKAVALSDSQPQYLAMLANAYARGGRGDEARRLLADLEALDPSSYYSARPIMGMSQEAWYAPELYVALGDTARAVAIVLAEFEEHPHHFAYMRCQTVYPELVREPPIQEIVRRIGFPE